MKLENITSPRLQKQANATRVALRDKLEARLAQLNPADHPNRYRQLIGQLLRLDKKIAAYGAQFEEGGR